MTITNDEKSNNNNKIYDTNNNKKVLINEIMAIKEEIDETIYEINE